MKTIVLIGHSMVGHRFCEKLVEFDTASEYRIVTFCEEPRAAYDRVGLTSFFAHRDAEQLRLARMEWYEQQNIELHIGVRAQSIDREAREVIADGGLRIPYDHVVLATGSFPFIPPIPGVEKTGVFAYRTIEDLERIIERGKTSESAVVIGGGLLGLEAARATHDLGLKTHVVEFAPRLMPRQLDDRGSGLLLEKIQELGVDVHLDTCTESITGELGVEAINFKGGQSLKTDMVVISAGIRPRDELARDTGIELGPRGGIIVNDQLATSDPDIFAIGEVALHEKMIYGLVAPGYDMAETLAAVLCGNRKRAFTGSDMSAKLKLMGVDVASFGDYEAGPEVAQALTFEDPFTGIYKKLLFSLEGDKLLGGMLVGDASDYGLLRAFALSGDPLPTTPAELIGMGGASLGGADALPDDTQVCSCNNVSKGQICSAIRDGELRSIADVKCKTDAGTGCGGCMPMVTDIFKAEMASLGVDLKNTICEHFDYSRQELFHIIKVKKLTSFPEVLEVCGQGRGCEVCKPTVASIIASLWNEHIVDHDQIQDTNDRFLANVQRQGLYSVVPRVPGGEITPDKLIVLGEVAKEYGLYSKITGGQRVDLFGARVDELPEIWERLIDAGFESGHAYGKALRTVKSCVGSTWCRFGVQDSVGFAIRVEERYRGIRSPHKLKSAVSGCTRECAEAQSKDFGLIATEKGWNLSVCGNGGMEPRHADLFASDLDGETVIRYIDRFLMYYIHTADKLNRTSVWLEKLEGGIEHLRDVVINDSLGICAELEADMNRLVSTYKCEWDEVVKSPEKRARFAHFANSDEVDPSITTIPERGQRRVSDWSEYDIPEPNPELDPATFSWVKIAKIANVPEEGGIAVQYGKHQLALFNFASRNEWYASQNLCPHKRDMVLARGMLGEADETPKVACPLHKKTFDLATGKGMSDPRYEIQTFEVKLEGDDVLLHLPPESALDALSMLGRAPACSGSCESKRELEPTACVPV